MIDPRAVIRPYTNPTIRTPTYPTILQNHMIVEMTWEDRMRDLHKQETTRNITDTRLY